MPDIVSKLVDKVKEQAPKKKQPWELMVIPFKKEPPRYVSKEDRLSFKLLSTPSDTDSITYEVKTYAFDDGLPEEWLEHVKTYRKIVAGQDITTGAPAFAMLKRLLKGKALADFERIFAEEAYTNSMDNVNGMLAKLTKEIFPDRALQKQRRALRRYVRKPEGMRTSTFYARLVEMNEQLKSFPDAGETDKLGSDELKEILEFALPKTWRVHMTLSRFMCDEKTAKDILDFCKDIEGLEAEHGSLAVAGVTDNKRSSAPTNSTSSSRKRKRESRRSPKSESSEKGQKYCPVHGWCSHTAEDCVALKDAISSGKRKYTEKRQKTSGGSDKTYSKQNYSKQELNVMISSACDLAVDRAFKAAKAATSEKRQVTFHTSESTSTVNTTDIQQQVDQLKLYRDKDHNSDNESSSSESSAGST